MENNNNKLLKRYEKWGFPQEEHFPHKQYLRINTNAISPKKLITRLEDLGVYLKKVPFLFSGYQFRCDFPLSSSTESLLGYFYIQEAPAQIPGAIIREELKSMKYEEVRVLDMCAAPGGKTSQISADLRNKGEIIALDPSAERVKKLCYNLERMKCSNVTVYKTDALEFNDRKKFDVVLLDAPCSGNYTQGRDWIFERTTDDFRNRAEIQTNLLDKALSLVKPGGLVVYSTCSLEMEENEFVVESALSENVILEDIKIDVGHSGLSEETKKCIRIWPTQDKLPGFFIAKIRKVE